MKLKLLRYLSIEWIKYLLESLFEVNIMFSSTFLRIAPLNFNEISTFTGLFLSESQ